MDEWLRKLEDAILLGLVDAVSVSLEGDHIVVTMEDGSVFHVRASEA